MSRDRGSIVRFDKAWIEQAFTQRGRRLRSFLQRRVRNQDEIADLVQEVYLRLLRVPDSATVENPEGYIFAVARNLIKERALLARRFSQSIAHDAPEIEMDLALEPAFGAKIDAEVRVRRVRQVLEELSPKCRAAIVLHYRDGLSYAEIGLRLGISESMAKKYRSQALRHCRWRIEYLR